MLILIIFAFLAGIVTILSPCILPILPLVLSVSSGRTRPLGVVLGFVASFTFFTLFLSSIVRLFGIPADSLRFFAILTLALFGTSLLSPSIQLWIEQFFSRLSSLVPSNATKPGLWSGITLGLTLGLLWTPCVGPILASVISLALTGEVTGQAFMIALAYSVGTAIPMFVVMVAGSRVLRSNPWLLKNSKRIQRGFGVLMITTAIAIFFNLDRRFQTYVLGKFPGYGLGLTKFEDNKLVQNKLTKLGSSPVPEVKLGRPMTTLPRVSLAPELVAGGQWFNSNPFTLESKKGKVVLVDFWTYTCINCQRTLPYLKSWYEKYKDKGLVIIGVHTPEFEFEKDAKNVKEALADFGITYPVMQDNNFATWNAYHNRYWPAKYLIDKDGYVRYTHFGEGNYDETEEVIQDLLEEAGSQGVRQDVHNPGSTTYARTPETYLGKARSAYNPDLKFAGDWKYTKEYAVAPVGGTLTYRYEAKSVYLVMRTPDTKPTTVRVYLDEVEQKPVTVTKDTLYTLVELASPGTHTIRLEFPEGGVELYAFTFG